MADKPSKRVRQNKNAMSNDSTAKNNDSVCERTTDCQSNNEVSRNGNKRKQATLDRYLFKKLIPEVKTVTEPTINEIENVVVEAAPETMKCELSVGENTEAVCKQASDDVGDMMLKAVPETLKYGSSLDTDATVATLEYESDSVAVCATSAVTSDSSPKHLELGEMAAACETGHDLPPLSPLASHTVLFIPDTADEQCTIIPKPFPDRIVLEDARWDNDHVRLPYSPQNKLLINKVVVGRWDKIVSSLNTAEWKSSYDIEKAILSYNKYRWDFTELHHYFQMMTEEENDLFFSQTLPKVAELAVNLPSICTQPIPLLRKQKAASVSMSQQQAACLLANAFFCTFPSRNTSIGSDDDAPHLPSINFNSLYRRASASSFHARHAKLDCLLHYFRRVTTDMPRGTLTFKRQVLEHSKDWAKSTAQLQKLLVMSDGTIEDNGTGMMQVDFANKFVGGGVLDEGCVQEEIRFLICPELIVSRLITEELDANESLFITGCERFSNYTGYGRTTRWLSDHRDGNGHDSWGRLNTQIVAIDARVFHSLSSQLLEHSLLRELNKAYCGFCGDDDTHCGVATGNWGCGAFGGDMRLKALLQLMAAAEAKRPVCYFTFGDHDLCRDIFQVWESASSVNCTVGNLWTYILEAAEQLCAKKDGSSSDIYQHIIAECTSS